MTEKAVTADRGERGKFALGNRAAAGNGRRQTELMRAALEPHREMLIARMLALSTGTGVAAARAAEWCLERLGGPNESHTVLPRIEGLMRARTPADKARVIVAAVADGVISIEAGERVLRALASATAIVQASEFEERLAALEAGREARTIDLGGGDDRSDID